MARRRQGILPPRRRRHPGPRPPQPLRRRGFYAPGYTPTLVPHPPEQGSARHLRPPADLGYLHRPTYIPSPTPTASPHPPQRAHRRPRQGWNQAPKNLPRRPAPGRPQARHQQHRRQPRQAVELTALVDAQAGGGGPELHLDKPSEWINPSPPRQHTGSASLFMGMAIGVMGSYIDGGGSAAINLHATTARPASSSSAPAARQAPAPGPRRSSNQVTLAIDLANYR